MAVLRHVFSMAMISLIVLVVQNSLLVVMTRFSRKNIDVEHNYYTSTLVLNQECVKMLMCLIIYAFDDVRKQFRRDGSSATVVTVLVDAAPETGAPAAGAVPPASTATAAAAGGAVSPNVAMTEFGDAGQELARAVGASAHQPAALVAEGAFAGERMTEEDGPSSPSFTPGAAAVGTSAAGATPITTRRTARVAVPPPPSAASPTGEDSGKEFVGLPPRRIHPRLWWWSAKAAAQLYCSMLRTAVIKRDTLKLLVPAVLFNLQNFLIFIGLSNLDAVSFQVWSQTKLLSTALFSVWLLHRKLSPMQWLSLVALTAGVLGAQLGAPKTHPSSVTAATLPSTTKAFAQPRGGGGGGAQGFGAETLPPHQRQFWRHQPHTLADDINGDGDGDDEPQAKALLGIAACVISGLSSSYAGVYFEKVVKTTSPTLSIRNIQLSIFGIPLAFASMLLLDVVPRWYEEQQCGQPVHWNIFRDPFAGQAAVQYGMDGDCPVRPFYFWQRYDQWLTWGLVGIHAFGGLLVAIVVKYADNILKGFATGVAVIVSGMMSSFIWGYKPSMAFVLGAFLVIGSSIAFHKFEPKR